MVPCWTLGELPLGSENPSVLAAFGTVKPSAPGFSELFLWLIVVFSKQHIVHAAMKLVFAVKRLKYSFLNCNLKLSSKLHLS